MLTYTRRYIAGWAIAVAILLFPIGLLALLARRRSVLTVAFEPCVGGTRVRLAGSGSPAHVEQMQMVAESYADPLASAA